MSLDFALKSPDEATFWASWIKAGICSEPREFTPEYPGILISDQTSQGWTPMKNGTPVSGWHANIRITDQGLIDRFTADLAQVDADGNLLPLFERTHAAAFFGLTNQPADPISGFPAGMRSTDGITYTDPSEFKSATNTWA